MDRAVGTEHKDAEHLGDGITQCDIPTAAARGCVDSVWMSGPLLHRRFPASGPARSA